MARVRVRPSAREMITVRARARGPLRCWGAGSMWLVFCLSALKGEVPGRRMEKAIEGRDNRANVFLLLGNCRCGWSL